MLYGGKNSVKKHLMKGKRTGKAIFAVLNIIIMGFIFGALSGDLSKLDEGKKWGLIFFITLFGIIILVLTSFFDDYRVKIVTMFFILAYAVLGIAEVALTKPDIGVRVETLGYLAILFMAFNWMYIHWRMCKLCA